MNIIDLLYRLSVYTNEAYQQSALQKTLLVFYKDSMEGELKRTREKKKTEKNKGEKEFHTLNRK